MSRISVRRSSIASRLLRRRSSKDQSRVRPLPRLPSATIRTMLRSSVMSVPAAPSRSFPIDGEYLQFPRRIISRIERGYVGSSRKESTLM